ncbi:NAD regulator [Asticcacaulis sp. EMRT-3]|uniref:NUDIX hydrolase n=1 Tax=Asticcacaulis sp. EMRT-3 TaxID=3040349 RepID=UPI0024AEB613|nr:NAD regulator [Asticcacaulis sp. EMRT-3]MDI7774244.1 NAD regulator [Asticcacaulis sp. EMRT-3]
MMASGDIAIELSAVVVTVRDNEAVVLCLNLPKSAGGPAFALPSGPFAPRAHRTFDLGLRAFVSEQTGFDIGYVEQLYSFGDDDREAAIPGIDAARIISVGYLALTPDSDFRARINAAWVPFQRFFPWEDWRRGDSPPALEALRPAFAAWCAQAATPDETELRRRRIDILFPRDFDNWNEERVLDRYELLYDAGLIGEARPGRDAGTAGGEVMASDHRRILATGLSRLRGKLKYRPVIFELMPERFTLLELQKSLEALSGLRLHKQNFRRGLERTGFVTPLGQLREDTGGRPAELYAYDRDRFRFSPSSGLSLPRA